MHTDSIIPISSRELQHSAASLQSAAATLSVQAYDNVRQWQQWGGLAQAQSFDKAWQKLEELNQGYLHVADKVKAVSSILTQASAQALVLEKLRDKYLHLTETMTEFSPMVALFMLHLRGLAELVDFMTARQIEQLGSSIEPGQLCTLADFQTLPASAIHEVNMMNAPSEYQALLGQNPDAQLLEVGDGKLVVAVGDIDSENPIITMVPGVGSSDPTGWHQKSMMLGRCTTRLVPHR